MQTAKDAKGRGLLLTPLDLPPISVTRGEDLLTSSRQIRRGDSRGFCHVISSRTSDGQCRSYSRASAKEVYL
jgi:hypothetical protein